MNLFRREKQKKTIYLLAGLVGLLAVIALLLAFTQQNKEEVAKLNAEKAEEARANALASMLKTFDGATTTPKQSSTSAQFNGSGLKIEMQEVGTAVIVHSLALEKPGFVVIYESNAKKQPNEIIGTSPFLTRGAYSIVSIAVPKPLIAGKTYFATIYFDANDNGFFERTEDEKLTLSEGTPVFVAFTASSPKL